MMIDPHFPHYPRIAIVDADSIVFAVATLAEKRCAGATPEEDIWFQTKTEDEAFEEVLEKIEALVQDAECEDAIVCLSGSGRCFRYDVLPTYKGNRKATRQPAQRTALTERLQRDCPYSVLRVETLEADDVCGISATSLHRARAAALARGLTEGNILREPVVISIDKDLLQIPGLNYNPGVHGNGYKVTVTEVTEASAFRWHMYQTLVGDDTDGYSGCPGVGTKKANAILDQSEHLGPAAMWQWVVEAYRKKGLTEEDALTQARCARILRAEDWNQESKEVILWVPPVSLDQQQGALT